ncbi:MAG: hypothetical protein ACLPJH_00275 [Myxococcaceae bacterium]
MNKSRFVLFVLLGVGAAGLFVSCSGSSDGTANPESDLIAACNWPAAADTSDADGGGCTPRSQFNVCEVSNGATVLADGGVLDGTETCKDECSPAEYALACVTADISGSTIDVPTPALSLECTIIPGPTPLGAAFYCCPCAP